MMRAVVTWPPALQSVCDHRHGILASVSVIFPLAIRAAQDARQYHLRSRFCCKPRVSL
jgi:hypothetical protein